MLNLLNKELYGTKNIGRVFTNFVLRLKSEYEEWKNYIVQNLKDISSHLKYLSQNIKEPS